LALIFFFTFFQLRLKLNTTFMLQCRCRPLCCNILYYYIMESE